MYCASLENAVWICRKSIPNTFYSFLAPSRNRAWLCSRQCSGSKRFKRNSKRFPEDFMFQLSNKEVERLLSQNAIPSRMHFGCALPYVFTKQGVAGIFGELTGKRAITDFQRLTDSIFRFAFHLYIIYMVLRIF